MKTEYEIRAHRDCHEINRDGGWRPTMRIGAVVIGTDGLGNKFEKHNGDWQDVRWQYFETAQQADERVALINNLKIKDWDDVPGLDSFEEVEPSTAPSM